MVEGGMTCVKYLLFAFNLLFFIFGLALIGVGAFVQIQLSDYFDFFSTGNVNATAILIIAVGVLTLIVGFFGCCGAIKENYCMLMTFAALITIILICEIAGGIAAFVLRGKVEDIVRKGMKESMKNYDSSEGVNNTWNKFQKEFECCGIDNKSDWAGHSPSIPRSCCKDEDCNKNPYYSAGCLPKLEKFLKDNIGYVAGVAVGLGVVELLGIILACCLARAKRRQSEYA